MTVDDLSFGTRAELFWHKLEKLEKKFKVRLMYSVDEKEITIEDSADVRHDSIAISNISQRVISNCKE